MRNNPSIRGDSTGWLHLMNCDYSLRLNLLCGEQKAVYRVACFEWNFGSNEQPTFVGRQRQLMALQNEFCKRN